MKEKSLTQDILAHLVICGSRLIVGSLFVPYGQSLGRTLRQAERDASLCTHDFSRHSHGTISVTLHRMKKKKLVSISGPKKKAIWRITQKGRSHFKNKENPDDTLNLPAEDGRARLVAFDIPEDRRMERNWLRRTLVACDYTLLQKSVFMGIRPLPARLLQELKNRKLLSHVHIAGIET